jgi:hypothetical protein
VHANVENQIVDHSRRATWYQVGSPNTLPSGAAIVNSKEAIERKVRLVPRFGASQFVAAIV